MRRWAWVIRNPRELVCLLSTGEVFCCVISASRYREMGLQALIIHQIGDDLLIANHE